MTLFTQQMVTEHLFCVRTILGTTGQQKKTSKEKNPWPLGTYLLVGNADGKLGTLVMYYVRW